MATVLSVTHTPAGRAFHGRGAELELLGAALRRTAEHGAAAVLTRAATGARALQAGPLLTEIAAVARRARVAVPDLPERTE